MDGVEEVKWLQSLIDEGRYTNAKAIVGSCELSSPTLDSCLEEITTASSLVIGLCWLLQPAHAPRVNGTELLKDSAWKAGFAKLRAYNLTWDIQCDPDQLPDFLPTAKANPETLVCINHLGRLVAWPANSNEVDQAAIALWRTNMAEMAKLSNVYIKVSMLGHMVPDWVAVPSREALVRQLVLETVELIGPERCMVNTNWWLNAAIADSDGTGTVGPEPTELLQKTMEWFTWANLTKEDKEWLYWKTAETFYLGKDYGDDNNHSGAAHLLLEKTSVLALLLGVQVILGIFIF